MMVLKTDGANSPREPKNINLELDQLAENIALLEVELKELRSIFSPVLNPYPADEVRDEGKVMAVSPVADSLRNMNHRLVDCIHTVRDVIGECDL